jgi:predicted nucleotidyltransferase component of viral defense system
MDNNHIYYQQVKLLIQLLSFIKKEECFALNGGTAINLFFRDFPRFSVDIDLVFLPLSSREEAILESHKALLRISTDLRSKLIGIKTKEAYQDKDDALRLIVSQNNVQVKIELSPVLRGVVMPCETKTVRAKVEEEFGFAEMKVASFEDTYAGKICAALDRQHPRDLYDVHELLKKEGISEQLRKTFIVY